MKSPFVSLTLLTILVAGCALMTSAPESESCHGLSDAVVAPELQDELREDVAQCEIEDDINMRFVRVRLVRDGADVYASTMRGVGATTDNPRRYERVTCQRIAPEAAQHAFAQEKKAFSQCSQPDRAPFAWAALINVGLVADGALNECVPFKVTDPRPRSFERPLRGAVFECG